MTAVQQLAALVLVAWLPGAVIFRMPWADRERRAALDPEERVFWAVILSLATSLIVVLALAATGRYTFERLLIANAALTLAAVLLWRSGLRLRAPRPFAVTALIPLGLLVLCLVRFGPPSEYIIGGKDPGTYMNEGVQIAQRGSLVISDAVVASVPNFARDLFFPQHKLDDGTPRPDYYGIRFMGFPINDPDTGTVIGQFPHLFPASIAIGYGLDGLTGARRTTPAWALLGVLAVYFAGARVFGRTVAATAAVLLALNVLEVWFARYPNAEVVMQTLLFAALLANARAHVDGDRFFAPVAGALIGLLLFLRFDAVLGAGGLAAGLVAGLFARQRPRLSAIVTLALFAIPAVYYFFLPMRAYAHLPIVWVGNIPAWQTAAGVALAVAALAAAWISSRQPGVGAAVVRYLPVGVAAVLCLLAAYALFLREPAGRLAAHDAYALRSYANYYVTVPAVLAALIGYAIYARVYFWRDPAFFMTAALFAMFFFYKIRIVPEHFWAGRRYLAVILPATMLFAAAAAFGPGGGGRRRLVRPLLGGVLIVLLGTHYLRASRPVADHVEYAGLIHRIEELAAQIGTHDLLIVESRDAGSDVHVVALPLAYMYGRNVLVLDSARPDKSTFGAFLDWARTRYDRVLFLGSGGTDLLSHRYGVQALASERFQVPEYESARNAYPRGIRQKEFEYGIYEFAAAAEPGGAPGLWFDLDVGFKDDLHVLRFHAKEPTEGRTFRWTRARSMISVTTISADSRTVTLTLADGGRPAGAPPARLEVFLHNQHLGSVVVQGPFRTYSFDIPADLARRAAAAADPVELRLVTETWKPSEVLGAPDDRDLGVMVDRVTIR